jgi:Na+-transporting NADH:ubiquinone oxidoreductase subunit C
MAINKNSNLYTVLYTVVMVVIVGALLATVATVLKPMQEANVLNEQKSSIMKAFGDENGDFAKVKVYVLGENGARLELTSDADIKKVFELISNRKDLAAADLESGLPYFEYDEKIVIPIVGKGLWGDIWGYVALKRGDNGVQVAGIVMDHAGETPGLGAEIATEGVQKKFVDKYLFNGGEFALRMQKGGAKPGMEDFQVDAITGGTKTCDGVNDMLKKSLMKYESLF